MSTSLSILIIDDDVYISKLLENYLLKEGMVPIVAPTGKKALEIIKKEAPDVVLCDIRLPDIDGVELLSMIKKVYQDVPVIMMTAYADIRSTVQAIKKGAYDYVSKPVFPEEILSLIRDSLEEEREKGRKGARKESEGIFISGNSPKMQQAVKLAKLVAPTDMSVLIQGETGSGKEFIARQIHDQSERKNKQFVAIDCGAIPHELAASELFGHVKGAFTGAVVDKTGYFEKANKGTIFLDEIGNLSYETQVKLLRAIQQKVISRVGDSKNIPVDVRIISATNSDLKHDIEEGNFREDLYHRINEFKIEIPALRERGDDILLFASHFLEQANQELSKRTMGFESRVEEVFKMYDWPGNLRELRNVVKRSVLIAEGELVTSDCLPEEIRAVPPRAPDLLQDLQGEIPDLKDAIKLTEREVILKTLKEENFNKTRAAKALNIDRKTLYNKMRQLGIELSE